MLKVEAGGSWQGPGPLQENIFPNPSFVNIYRKRVIKKVLIRA
jgi:hypothetical protein